MDIEYRVIVEHKRSYDEGCQLRRGETVDLGPRDTHWSSWLWCTTSSGQSAWVPEQILNISNNRRAVVTADYNSIELTVKPGDMVMGIHVLSGWVWCKNIHNETGWVPLENLQPARN